MIWNELVKVALLGTERSKLSSSTLDYLEQLGIDVDEEVTQVFLQAAALYHQQYKVGKPFPILQGDLPERVGDDTLEVCNARSSHHLQLIINQTFAGVLPEFIYHLIKNKKQLPPEQLPALLDKCVKDLELYEELKEGLGERGKWLIQQNKAWQKLAINTDLETWATGKKEERFALIRYLRQTAPELAITLLESTWQKESLNDKVAFLKLLATGLSLTDEPFLEEQLDNKRKELRVIAAELLVKIPASALVQRMIDRVEACLTFENEQLSINLPEELANGSKRDGINPAKLMYPGGLKASHFGQLLAATPPQHWEDYLGCDAHLSLGHFLHTNWKNTTLEALLRATIRFKNIDWVEAILHYWIANEDNDLWKKKIMEDFIILIPNELFNQTAIEAIKNVEGLLSEDTVVTKLLSANAHIWEDDLSISLVKGFQHWLNHTDDYMWNTWHYRELLKIVAIRCTPNLYGTLKQGWRFSNSVQIRWEKEIEQLMRTLIFRREMIKELEVMR